MGQVNTKTLGLLLNEMKGSAAFKVLIRKPKVVDMDTFIEEIKLVGRSITPKFTIDDYNEFAYKNIALWLHGQPFLCLDPDTRKIIEGDPTKGIYVAGGTGTGKSLSLRILNYLSKQHGFTVTYSGETTSVSLQWDEIHASGIVDKVLKTGDVKAINDHRILCIQDLGTEPPETVYMGNRIDPVKMLLEKRGDDMDKLTLITSNYPMGHDFIAERYGSRVKSRLRAMCNYFEMTGNDRRR